MDGLDACMADGWRVWQIDGCMVACMVAEVETFVEQTSPELFQDRLFNKRPQTQDRLLNKRPQKCYPYYLNQLKLKL